MIEMIEMIEMAEMSSRARKLLLDKAYDVLCRVYDRLQEVSQAHSGLNGE
jgi:hypothetical protein